MSFKKEEPKKVREFDYKTPEGKQIILDFEKKLNGRSWQQYCLDMRYEIETVYPCATGTYKSRAINGTLINDYSREQRIYSALEALRRARYEAERYEHDAYNQARGIQCECPKFCKIVRPKWTPNGIVMQETKRVPPIIPEPERKYCEKCDNPEENCTCIRVEDIPF